MDEIGNLLKSILGELTSLRGIIWALGVVAVILVRIAWELWRINARGASNSSTPRLASTTI